MGWDLLDNTKDENGNPIPFNYRFKSVKKFLLLPISRVYKIYLQHCQENSVDHVGWETWLNLRTFDLKDPTECDRIHCSCHYCFNHFEMANAVEKLTGFTLPTGDVDALRKIISKNSHLPGITCRRMVYEQVGVKKDGTPRMGRITKTVSMNWEQLRKAASDDYWSFKDHYAAWVADCKYYSEYEQKVIDDGGIVIQADFSQNINCDSKEECQQSFFGKETLCLHVSVVKFKFQST